MPVLQRASLEFVDHAELVISYDVDLPAEIEEVWAVIADNDSWPEWFHNCTAMTSSHNPWTAPGQSRTIHVKPFKIREVAVAIEAPHLWAMQLSKTNLPMARRALEMLELSDTSRHGEVRTEVRWTGAFDRPMYFRPAASIFENQLLGTWGPSLENLLDAVIARR